MKAPTLGSRLRIPIFYVVLGTAWIILTDLLAKWLIPPASSLYVQLQTVKGWIFVVASALFFFILLRAEETRRWRLEQQYRQLFHSSPNAIFIVDQSGRYVEANQRAIERYGFTYEELLSMTVRDLVPEELKKEAQKQLQASFVQGGGTFHWRHRRKDNSVLEVEISARPVEWRGQTCMMSTVVDITERQVYQRTLEESERRYRTLFTNSPTPLWEEDFSDVKAYLDHLQAQGTVDFEAYFAEQPEQVQQILNLIKILDVNEAACKLYEARSKEELMMTGLSTILGAEAADNFAREIILIAQGIRQFDMEITVRNLRGEQRFVMVHWMAAPGFEDSLERVYVAITDITERRLIEENLRQSNEKLQTLIQASPLAIYTLDRDGRVQLWNPAAEQVFGWEAAEAVGRPLPVLPPEQQSSFQARLEKVFLGQTILNVEVERYRRDGSPVVISLTAAPMRRMDGVIDQVMNIAADITESKRLENERNNLLERLNLILDQLPIACVIHDPSYRINYWNPAAAQIFGYSEAEALGGTPDELFVPPEAQEFVKGILGRLSNSTTSIQAVNVNMTKDGRRIICEWQNTPLTDSSGSFIGYLAMAQDVTERTRIIEVLQESEQRFRRLVDSNIIGVVIFESEGTVIEANEAFLRMTAYEHSDLPLSWFALIPPAEWADEKQALGRIGTLGVAQPAEKEIRRKDGRQIPVLVGATRLDEPAQVITFVLDLSEAKQKEAQIRASLAEKEVLLREVHHRVKNNLEVIISLAELQTIKISDPATLGSIRELQERIRSIALVHENLYRSDNLEQIHVQTYLDKLVNFLIISFASSEYDVRVDADDVVMNIEQAIPCGLIVNELVTNAFKHAFPKEMQLLSPPEKRQIHIRLVQDEQNYHLMVRDNGVGLPEDLDPQQAATLGLRLVSLLSLQLHGQLLAETAAGAQFTIIFPRRN